MDSVRTNNSNSASNPPEDSDSTNQKTIFTLKNAVFVLLLVVLGFGAGYFIRGAAANKVLTPDSARKPANAVITSAISFVAPVEGELVERSNSQITLKKGGFQLKIEIDDTTTFLDRRGIGTVPPSLKKISEIEKGVSLQGTVIISPEFAAGDKEGKVTGSSFVIN